MARSFNLVPLGIVLNMVKQQPHELGKKEVEEITRLPVLATVPYDEEIGKALSFGRPILTYNPYSLSALEFTKLAGKLCGIEFEEKKPSIFSKIFLELKNRFLIKKPSIKPESLIEKI
jgi:MinD-like ATPase involved in chromosome partitioning or flagellar assembly